jgi:hypothetical protein
MVAVSQPAPAWGNRFSRVSLQTLELETFERATYLKNPTLVAGAIYGSKGALNRQCDRRIRPARNRWVSARHWRILKQALVILNSAELDAHQPLGQKL